MFAAAKKNNYSKDTIKKKSSILKQTVAVRDTTSVNPLSTEQNPITAVDVSYSSRSGPEHLSQCWSFTAKNTAGSRSVLFS